MLSHFSCTGDKPKVLGLLESKPLLTALETLLLKVATIDIAATLSRKQGEDYHQSGSAKTRPSWFTREKTAGNQALGEPPAAFIREPTNHRAHQPSSPNRRRFRWVSLSLLACVIHPMALGNKAKKHEDSDLTESPSKDWSLKK